MKGLLTALVDVARAQLRGGSQRLVVYASREALRSTRHSSSCSGIV
jgi:hypothetical protein